MVFSILGKITYPLNCFPPNLTCLKSDQVCESKVYSKLRQLLFPRKGLQKTLIKSGRYDVEFTNLTPVFPVKTPKANKKRTIPTKILEKDKDFLAKS